MQGLRRALALRLPRHDGFAGLGQQAAAMSDAAGGQGGGDGKLQMMLKALEPQAVEAVAMTPEELAEAERRCVPRVPCAAAPPDRPLTLSRPLPNRRAGPRSTAS